ncbi:DUF3653 domain-containing protein [Vibrio tasmaniensis]|uniref:DUF3653 domain-containing protein n=1 Tax=Vibrio tasmaniensis TaxID=212663 RepID=UPI001F0D70BE|nr:helix-turn-helix domain-containing protein [Vibrio tasmaniensis]
MLITMSEKDIHRFKVLTDVREKRLRQVDAAIILNLSARHIRRLVNKLVSLGAQSLTHAARGRPSNRRYSEHFRIEKLKLVREHYSDFSPTMAEKLIKIHVRGYLPLDYRWDGFRVHFDHDNLITPERREFNPKKWMFRSALKPCSTYGA